MPQRASAQQRRTRPAAPALVVLAVLVLGLYRAGGAGAAPGASPAAAPASAPALSVPTASAASATALPNSRFTLQGLPPVLAGQTVTQAEQALGQALRPELPTPARPGASAAALRACAYSGSAAQPGVRYAVSAGVVTRIETRDPRYRSRSGLQVGDTAERARQVYGKRLVSTPHPYFDKGRMLLVYAPDKRFALVMESNDQGRIITLRGGRLPEVAWLEAC